MNALKDLLFGVSIDSVQGSTDVAIKELFFDSRKVTDESLFIAVRGDLSDGHNYIDQAIGKGAKAIVCEEKPANAAKEIVWVVTPSSRKALAIIASNFYGQPSKKLALVGVTGTNGKTSVTTLLFTLFQRMGYSAGLISTIAVRYNEAVFPATHTTPDPIQLNAYLSQMVDRGVDYCFMEVSSHGIAQDRIEGLNFKGGVFTNLSHDHLDYHGSFKAYRDVKKRFFDQLPKQAFALTNSDDKNGDYMLQNTLANRFSFGLKNYAQYRAKVVEKNFEGMLISFADLEVWTHLVGDFNASNLLAVYAVTQQFEIEAQDALTGMSSLKNVTGRFETFSTSNQATVIVDYAHTPDALKNVLHTINSIRSRNEVLITLVGCGGDRDEAKRPKMAQIAAELSNKTIFTSDNPRGEDPELILDAMEQGLLPDQSRNMLRITDRKSAIKAGCMQLQKGDILLIAGKGHEKYQEIKGKRFPFDDLALVKEFCKK